MEKRFCAVLKRDFDDFQVTEVFIHKLCKDWFLAEKLPGFTGKTPLSFTSFSTEFPLMKAISVAIGFRAVAPRVSAPLPFTA